MTKWLYIIPLLACYRSTMDRRTHPISATATPNDWSTSPIEPTSRSTATSLRPLCLATSLGRTTTLRPASVTSFRAWSVACTIASRATGTRVLPRRTPSLVFSVPASRCGNLFIRSTWLDWLCGQCATTTALNRLYFRVSWDGDLVKFIL